MHLLAPPPCCSCMHGFFFLKKGSADQEKGQARWGGLGAAKLLLLTHWVDGRKVHSVNSTQACLKRQQTFKFCAPDLVLEFFQQDV
mmetsp:Transcript_57383/g.83912  ORF Transcript_57383/g.83912 Transcript_57383/m.83912 type:complete len:86 (-) Transcript_57383:11-268(-)